MKLAQHLFSIIVSAFLTVSLWFPTSVVRADSELPDLTIVEQIAFHPGTPEIGEYFDVVVNVQNLGADSTESTIQLHWCCGDFTRVLEPIEAGETVEVVFEKALMFADTGTYAITVEVDANLQISESNESNNSLSNTVAIKLGTSPFESEKTLWGDEKRQFSCADVDLMKIGRLGPPFVMEDSDDLDAIPDRFIREPEPCAFDTDPTLDECQIYLKGQISRACGTTSLAYTLRYFGVDVWPEQVDDELRNDFIVFDDKEGMFTDPIGLKEFAIQKGLNAEIYTNGTIEDIRSYVDRGIPVLLNISNTAGEPNIFKGHWVVVISFCEEGSSLVGGIDETVIGIYDPKGRQFGISPEHLLDYWDDLYFYDVYLWSRLYIPITDESLPYSTSADDVAEQLAVAQGIAEGMTGLQDLYDTFANGEIEKFAEGVIELTGGAVTVITGAIATIFGWGEEVPLVGGFLSATSEYLGDLTLIFSDITQAVADLANPDTWTDTAKLGEGVLDCLVCIGDLSLQSLEYVYDLIVDGIGELLRDIGGWFEEIGCDWFGLGCDSTVVFYKHNASSDACMETQAFLNNYFRVQELGYLFTEPVEYTMPLYLYADPILTQDETLGENQRRYYVCTRPNWAEDDPSLLYLGLLGYSQSIPSPGGTIDLYNELITGSRNLVRPDSPDTVSCDPSNNYGYLLTTPRASTSILYLMKSLNTTFSLYGLSLDRCNGTETFVTENAKGYTRELQIGDVLSCQVDGTTKLYRAFNDGVVDFQFYTDPTKLLPGFQKQGFVGYVYTEQVPGTVPLYQFWYKGRDDHLLTLDPTAEGLPGYTERETLGYIFPAGTADSCCHAPLWRFCKRLERQE